MQAPEAARATLEGHEPHHRAGAHRRPYVRAAGPTPEGTVISVVGEVQVCVRLAGAIDMAAEERADRQGAQEAGEGARRRHGAPDNPSFKDCAPPDVVEKTQRDLAGLDERLAKLTGSLERLETL